MTNARSFVLDEIAAPPPSASRSQPGQAGAASRADAAVNDLLDQALRFQSAGQLEPAKNLYLRILSIDVKHAWSLYGLGQIAFLCGNCDVAAAMFRRAIASDDREPLYHAGLGCMLQALGNLEEAAHSYRLSLALAPGSAPIRANLGGVLMLLGRAEEAEAEYRKSLDVDSGTAHVYKDLGTVLRARGRLEESAAACRAALALDPGFAAAHDSLAQTLREQGKFEEAASEYQHALRLNPHSANTHTNLSNLQLSRGLRREARASLERALSLNPDAKVILWNRSLLDLLEGNYQQGWRDYEVRCELNFRPPRNFPCKRWRGEPLHGARILIHSEQGLGDTLQFLRYVPMVQAAGGQVILDVPHRVQRLAETLPGLAALTVDGLSLPDFEYHSPLMSLPLAFATTLDSIPSIPSCLCVPKQAESAAASLPWPHAGLRVGLIWSSGPTGPSRSMPLAEMQPLLDLEGIHFFSLQLGPAAAEAAQCRRPIVDLEHHMSDLADTGALMQQLDLVITVDTCTAHLAGALGLPAWVLLPFAPDWRWLLDRDDSPWYPTLRLFRQPRPGLWTPVIDRIRHELARLMNK